MYGSEDTLQSPTRRVSRSNSYPGGHTSYDLLYGGVYRRRFSRSGTNSPSIRIKQPASTGFRKVFVKVRGPKVSYSTQVLKKVKVRTRNGYGVYFSYVKPVWVVRRRRSYILQERLKPVYHKERTLNVTFRRANHLDFSESVFVHYPGSLLRYYPPDDRWNHSYSWDQFGAFALLGSNTPVGANSADYVGNSSLLNSTIDRLKAETLVKINKSISDQNVNLAQVLAERKQTYSLLAEAVSRLASAYRAFRQRDLSALTRSLFPSNSKELANDILAWKFGVVPLISDIEGIAADLHKFDVTSKTVNVSANYVSQANLIGYTDGLGLRSEIYEDLDVTVKRSARLKVTSETLRAFQKLGLTNLASLAWELTPWSFVADWIFSVGNYLSSIENLAGCELESSWCTVFVKRRIYCKYSAASVPDGSGYIWSRVPPTLGWTISQVQCNRALTPDLTVSPWTLKFDPATRNHLLLSVSLLRQRFK